VSLWVSAKKERGERKSEKCQKSNSSWLRFEGPTKFVSLDFLVSLFDAFELDPSSPSLSLSTTISASVLEEYNLIYLNLAVPLSLCLISTMFAKSSAQILVLFKIKYCL